MTTLGPEPTGGIAPNEETAHGDETVDGRTSRRERNRAAVIAAALSLYDADRYPFTIQEVSGRSGVSVRSIYRYFANLDELVRSAAAVRMESLGALIEVFEPGDSPLAERIQRFLASRIALLERVHPVRVLSEGMGPSTDPEVLRIREAVQQRMHEQFETAFRPELGAMSADRRRHVTIAVDTMMQPAAIVFRREQLGMAVDDSLAMLADILELVLTPGPSHPISGEDPGTR